MTDTVWQCEQLRAGKVYSKELFQTRAEAEEFVARMARVAPDIFCRIEPIGVEKVWILGDSAGRVDTRRCKLAVISVIRGFNRRPSRPVQHSRK